MRLWLDASGNLYGTTYEAGKHGEGTAFELIRQPTGPWLEKILTNFGVTGGLPRAGMIFDSAGNLYGTTHSGPLGTVFELTPAADGSWTQSVLHTFIGHPTDGFGPQSNVIFDISGNLYGTTPNGGPHSYGTVYELSPVGDGSWTETLLHSFRKGIGLGTNPSGGLIFDNTAISTVQPQRAAPMCPTLKVVVRSTSCHRTETEPDSKFIYAEKDSHYSI